MNNIKQPNQEIYKQAQEILKKGDILAFPTETVYGLGANALNLDAVAKIFDIKKRPQSNPLSIMLPDVADITKYAEISNELEQKIIDQLLPGPLTIILKKKDIIDDQITAGSPFGPEYVGVRVPDHDVVYDMLDGLEFPIVAPSANISGESAPTSADEVYNYFGDDLPLIIDGGECRDGLASTVVKVEGDEIKVLREGGVTRDDLDELM